MGAEAWGLRSRGRLSAPTSGSCGCCGPRADVRVSVRDSGLCGHAGLLLCWLGGGERFHSTNSGWCRAGGRQACALLPALVTGPPVNKGPRRAPRCSVAQCTHPTRGRGHQPVFQSTWPQHWIADLALLWAHGWQTSGYAMVNCWGGGALPSVALPSVLHFLQERALLHPDLVPLFPTPQERGPSRVRAIASREVLGWRGPALQGLAL